ncbi:putative membrane protein YgcG [Psychromicrobium silvestre]|uniref:Putative membrane protein YgcG n=1 Tax=Psychromicrobium silvestre TaxID=1645614 RepID=A0A7Y9LSX3_9MICC|nr:TPM domain-containing protein [Psychromicrobium silvestre]NYE94993.1 putative membrane protein YgcG [Psychromicrobium silvestre]
MRSRFALFGKILTAVGLSAMLVLPAATATAQAATVPVESPVTIPAGQNIVDDAGVLGSRKSDVQTAITKLLNDKKYNFYVVTVKTFENPTAATDWAVQVAKNKGMGNFDLVLAIATDQGRFSLQKAINSKITNAQRDSIVQNAITPNLANGKKDYAQAAIDAAAAIGDAAGGGSGTVPNPTGGIVGTVIFIVLIVAAVTALLIFRRRKKQKALQDTASGIGPGGEQLDPMAGTSVAELKSRAGSLLIAADDAIKSSEQEISFAQAAYGDEAVKPFQAALAEAKNHLNESFKLQQQLDDEIPDTVEQQRSWYGEIIRRSEDANKALAEQKQSFDSLRELEKNAPQALATISSGAQEAHAALAGAQTTLAELQNRYADSATSTIQDNIAQAQQRLAFVDTATQTASQKLSSQDTAGAAVAVRAAEESLHQAKLLEDAIAKVATDLQAAAAKLPAALSEAQNDLAQAKAMVAAGQQNPAASGQVAAVEAVLSQVQGQLNAPKTDPGALLQQVETAHSNLDQLLTGIRDQQQQAQRAQSALQQAISSAQAQISSAQDYIAARRGGVGAEARTRIAEAQRNLDYALSIQSSDPVSALSYANQAIALAQQAAQYAQSDVSGFGYADSGYGRGGYGGGGGGGGFSGGFGGAILGGILGGMLSGGGHNNSNWGGGGFGGWSDGGGGGGGGFDFGGGGDGGGFGGGDSGGDGSF